MIVAIEQASRSDAIPVMLTGVIAMVWSVFVYRTGWTPTAIASRMRSRSAQPQRSGALFWYVCVSCAVVGLAAFITAIGLLV